MLKKLHYILFFTFFCNSFIYTQKSQLGAICNIEGIRINPEFLRNSAKLLPKYDELYGYLKRINKELNPPNPTFQIYDVPDSILAASAILPGDNVTKIIYVNKNYYKQLTMDSLDTEALFIYIIGHELSHHINEDVHYSKEQEFNSFYRELIADEKAGFLIGKLTDIDFDFFDRVINILLRRVSESSTHPAKKYRILAAKAGWIQAKIEKQGSYEQRPTRVLGLPVDKSQRQIKYRAFYMDQQIPNPAPPTVPVNMSNIRIYTERKINDSDTIIRVIKSTENKSFSAYFLDKNNKKCGLALSMIYNENDPKQIEFLNYENDSIKGEIFILTFDSIKLKENIKYNIYEITKSKSFNLSTKELYIGERNNLKYEGKGILFFDKGKCYSGNFKAGYKEGNGKLYENSKIVYSGDFKNDLYDGVGECFYDEDKIYFGYWKSGKENGQGIKYRKQSILENGCWVNGKFQGLNCQD
jgi:hypothetical protein